MPPTGPAAKRVVFLLGSGASQPAGLPMVPKITSEVRAGAGGDAEVVALVERIYEMIRPFYEGYKPSRPPNYEDIAYVTRQVADSIVRNYENPALLPFIESLCAVLGARDRGRVYRLCDDATGYIKGVVATQLAVPPTRTDHLAAVVGACRDERAHVTIASMNHDCVVEAVLRESSIGFGDGFVGPDGDLFVFQDRFPDEGSVVLLKLHGSTDWFRYQVPDTAGAGKRSIFVRSSNRDKEHLRDGAGRELGYTADPHPQILVGTFSKILDYSNFVFVDLHARLHQALKRADRLVIIGYGGQDKAINSKIIHWMDEGPTRTSILVDPSPDNLLRAGRAAIQANLRYWQQCGRLRVISRGVEAVSWEEIDGR